MEKSRIPYVYNAEKLQIGNTFKSFAELFQAVTGRKPPSGTKNLGIAKKNLAGYIDYRPLHEIDPSTSSKRAVCITQIHNPPLEIEENRGKRGRYADHLKQLILAQKKFEGTWVKFYENANVFEKCCSDNSKYNPLFSVNLNDFSGVNRYKYQLRINMRDTLFRALDSLGDQVKWEKGYNIMPNTLVWAVDDTNLRPKARPEFEKQNEQIKELKKFLSGQPNSILDFDELRILNIYDPWWNNSKSPDDYKCLSDYKYLTSKNQKDFIFKASPEQVKAIQHLESAVRQLVYTEMKNLETIPPIEEVPAFYKLSNDYRFVKLFQEWQQMYYPLLINCSQIWQVIEFEVVSESESIFTQTELAENLSREFIKYMDEHMSEITFYAQKSDKADVINMHKFLADVQGKEFRLDQSKATCKMHNWLQNLYFPVDSMREVDIA